MVTGLRGYAPASSALPDLGLGPGGAFGIAVREENRHSRFDRPVMTALSLRFRLMSRTVVLTNTAAIASRRVRYLRTAPVLC